MFFRIMGTHPEKLSADDQRVLDEYTSLYLTPQISSVLPLPSTTSPILISVVKNERDRLSDFLRHYRSAGVERFAFIDNGSNDGTFELLAGQIDIDLYQVGRRFDWRSKQAWINRVIDGYGVNRWFICADADEHVWFDGLGRRTFTDLAIEMESRSLSRVRGFLVDMYSDLPLLCSAHQEVSRLTDAYPFFDRAGYVDGRTRHLLSRTGGPRKRLFGANDPEFKPQLTKYPLFRLQPGEFMINPHHLWPCRANFESPCFLGILHFKFHANTLERIGQAVTDEVYWNNSKEYRCYLSKLRRDPELTAYCDLSERFSSASDLVRHGLIERITWTRDSEVLKRDDWSGLAREAARRRRAECLASDQGRWKDVTPARWTEAR